ncbi:RNA-directed RNA polymerase [ssRNA phage SRR6049586_1]|uniref:RNA-directed RNA polymerase n=1 Tax=ssRNA phage SRR6049586_1 TaxID=2786480 RepID=A0A8S5L1E4_9VIRU|nr:RNA-directed RNA polymerase [ssRNA phage SRR6049586_1]DAD50930.1 TPA_asm: RNA-directed RNA polymerase [ssRNA phage SRR6049586_1]
MSNFISPEVNDLALTFMEGLSCPRSLTVAILLRYSEVEQLVNLKCNPRAYLTPDQYLDAASATDFLRKVEFDIPGVDREASAMSKWWWAERECYKTNERLQALVDSDVSTIADQPVGDALRSFILQVRKELQSLIGLRPPRDWEIPGRFGPGATMSDSAQRSTVLHKLSSTPTLTPSALGLLFPWTDTAWARACANRGDVPSFVRGNSYFSVPKTALTHRSCAKEPSINGFYQLGLGSVLRNRLAKRGFDLVHGQSVHRQVACSASKSGELCTIDLTSASDTISINLVKLLLPREWFSALNSVRSTHTLVKGKWVRLEKFSSMGNGFTFELETAIFAAITLTACRGNPNVYVYGDDIIAPVEHASDVIGALRFFGFTPNADKTFVDGPFRESCGGDFFSGVAVRPFLLKELPSEPQDFITIANGIRRLALNNGQNPTRFARLRRSWFRCLDNIPSTIRRCRGPEGLGDIVIHDDESRWSYRWRSSIRYVRCYRPASFRTIGMNRFCGDTQMAAALYGIALHPEKSHDTRPGFDSRGIVVRDGVTGYKVGWAPFS